MAFASLGVAMARQARSERASLARESRQRPIEVHGDGYVSSSECRSCHPSEYASWHASYHRTMTQVASPESVKGRFDDVLLGGEPGLRLSRDGDRYFVQKDGPTAPLAPISLVTGSHHMQIYWYETGEGRKLGQLPYAFLLREQRWVPRGSVFLEPPQHYARPDESGRWSTTCIRCHATQGQPRIEAGAYDTHVREFGIACEACHGPGREHVESHRSPLARYASHLGAEERASIVHPGEIDHARASEICSQCHAVWQHEDREAMTRWNKHGLEYRPGDDPASSLWLFQPSRAASEPRIEDTLIREPSYAAGQFWSDGAARVSGREFSGMIDSPCYEAGELSCLSCHDMHKREDDPRTLLSWADDQLGAEMDGDRACVQCHDAYSTESQRTAHTRHLAASSGSRCYNCHMPHTSYGLMKAMRSHRIDVPSVESTVKTGRPNACNACHLDKSLGWAADQLHARYGIARPELTADQESVPTAVLQAVTGDAGERALVAWAMGWGPAQAASDRRFMPALLGMLMDDPYDSVRYIAERSLRALPDVDTRALHYDYVPRPGTRPPAASEVARLGALAEPEAASLASEMRRLKPLRDHRAVLLLE